MLRILVHHDVAGVEVHPHMLAAEAVDEIDHLLWRQEEAVEEDVLHIERHARLLGGGDHPADGVLGPREADVVRHRLVIGPPRDADGSRHHEHVAGAEITGAFDDLAGQFESPLPLGRIVARQRVGPEQERAEAADRDADPVGHPADLLVVGRAMFRREVALEVVVEFDPLEARLLGQSQALLERHLRGVGHRPEVQRLAKGISRSGRRGVAWRVGGLRSDGRGGDGRRCGHACTGTEDAAPGENDRGIEWACHQWFQVRRGGDALGSTPRHCSHCRGRRPSRPIPRTGVRRSAARASGWARRSMRRARRAGSTSRCRASDSSVSLEGMTMAMTITIDLRPSGSPAPRPTPQMDDT